MNRIATETYTTQGIIFPVLGEQVTPAALKLLAESDGMPIASVRVVEQVVGYEPYTCIVEVLFDGLFGEPSLPAHYLATDGEVKALQ